MLRGRLAVSRSEYTSLKIHRVMRASDKINFLSYRTDITGNNSEKTRKLERKLPVP